MSEWISVADMLPQPNKHVIAYSGTNGVFFAVRKNRVMQPWQYLDGDTCFQKVTHWMPLPEPPCK